MSLHLSYSSPPIEVKTWGALRRDSRGQNLVDLGSFMNPIVSIPMDDFIAMVEYVLQNSDLIDEDDPRIGLVERVKQLHQIKGYTEGAKRFGTIQSG